VLFINPAVHPDTQPVRFKPFIYAAFPTAIGYLAAYVREKNQDQVRIHDEQIEWLSERKLREHMDSIQGPRIVGISCLTSTAKRAYELTRMVKKLDSESTVILGGIHPTAVPEECLKSTAADIVVRGEGEQTLSEIYSALSTGGTFSGILGISYKENGNLVHNPARPLLESLEEIPPFPYDLFQDNLEGYRDFGTIISSRGCPFACIFCSQRLISGQRYRFLPPHRVMTKIRLLVDKYHQKRIFFCDDTFTINKKRTFALLDEIITSGYNKKACFVVESRGKEITWDLLLKMKEANIVSIAFGVETGSQKVMSILNKGETVNDNARAIELTHKAGIGADASIIMGLPSENGQDRRMTSRFARAVPLDGARFNIAIPYPGTAFYEMAKAEGRLNISENWSNCSNQHYLSSDRLPYTPVGITGSELVYQVFLANVRFMLRPKIILKTLFGPFMVGGTALSMKRGWYKSPRIWLSLAALMAFLSKRSLMIILKGGIAPKFRRFFAHGQPR
jgi:radical SAM superfamily enzyme YgiQ (UPF0313 family)